jgi:Capsular polysaccharide synthesis protein
LKLWAAWLQGRQNAPLFVRQNLDLWERLNPEHSLTVLEQKDTDAILADLGVLQPRITPQVTTDLARSYLLAKHGGAWVDSTLLPTVPISTWLTPDLRAEGFFAFRSLGDPNLVLQNWFLFAEAGNPVIVAWLEIFADYFRSLRRFPTLKRALWHGAIGDYMRYRKAERARDTLWHVDPARGRDCVFYPYAVHNYNFAYLLRTRPDLLAIWDRVPRRIAQLPEQIGQVRRDPETTEQDFLAALPELLSVSPVHKLNHHDRMFEKVVAHVAAGVDAPVAGKAG